MRLVCLVWAAASKRMYPSAGTLCSGPARGSAARDAWRRRPVRMEARRRTFCLRLVASLGALLTLVVVCNVHIATRAADNGLVTAVQFMRTGPSLRNAVPYSGCQKTRNMLVITKHVAIQHCTFFSSLNSRDIVYVVQFKVDVFRTLGLQFQTLVRKVIWFNVLYLYIYFYLY